MQHVFVKEIATL